MVMEKRGSKSGSGFFQLFDWNAKSRKKLFSSKSDLPEQSKQKRICDRSFPMTQLHVLDEEEVAGSSIRGSSDYSCASSVTDEDFCGTKAPGVVARLMGLDSMPTSNFSEPYSSPFLDSLSLRDGRYHAKNLEYSQDNQVGTFGRHKESSVGNLMVPKYQKPINRPIEKFQTEILPPKSAKSIPITHHKLLSPIKSANFIPSKDAAYIMEAAARIIDPGPQANRKAKLPQVGSSSVPLRVKNLKEKVQSAQSSSRFSEASRKPGETNAAKYFKTQSMDATSASVFTESEDCSAGIKNRGKSISLALQAKANVQKREGLNSGSSRSHKEHSVFSSNQQFKSQQNTQKITHKKPSTHGGSSVLRQNNQKQNCVNADRGKLPSKSFPSNLQDGKALSGDSSVRQRNYSKVSGNSKFGIRRSSSDTRDDKREVSCSSSERVSRKKRSVDGNYQYEKNQEANNTPMDKNQKRIQSNALMNRQNRWDQDPKTNGTDVVSFTFTTPMTRSVHGSERARETQEQCNDFSETYRTKRMLLSSDGMNKFSFPGNNVNGADALSTLLEQKFKELTCGVEFAERKVATMGSSASMFKDRMPGLNALRTSETHNNRTKDGIHTDGVIGLGGSRFSLMNECGNGTETKMFLDCRLPSPVSVLDNSSVTESFNSSDTAESNSTGGGKQSSSVQSQEVLGMYSLKKLLPLEGDAELSDSASSTSAGTRTKKHATTTSFAIDSGKSTGWELDYVKEILCNIELMFKDYALGRTREIINPHLFDQLESRKVLFNGHHGLELKISRKVLFDCVTECLDSRCRCYVRGGYKIWTNGLSVIRRKDRLAEEVYNEIFSWSCMGDFMVDELVDKDMSSKHGRWLDFDIEAFELGIVIEDRILTSLLDEVVDDILVL
ncbi:hypothetical protein Adt_47542 [Abeliophyllum distichum]|uniref:DUF4378 domain-containing protein n=1 Tax=Abeliophyllum distichum TaxID=126358 RepID=A0ABD1NTL4_9LAMI